MSKPSVCCVVPTIRETQMTEFRKAWAPLFEKHSVTLITVWDGEKPRVETWGYGDLISTGADCIDFLNWKQFDSHRDLFCRRTDAVRNLGFVYAASMGEKFKPDYILTLDDDVHPPAGSDPIQEHLDVLQRKVPISWMNTATEGMISGEHRGVKMPQYLRGFPYGIRDEAPVKVSHGVWVNVPDFDGRTQLELGKCGRCDGAKTDPTGLKDGDPKCRRCNGTGYDRSQLPYSLLYFRGPVPKGTYFPFCGMNVMVRKEALPYLYFAPMGPDSGAGIYCPTCEGDWTQEKADKLDEDFSHPCPNCVGTDKPFIPASKLNRFADIWCGILLKRAMDSLGWAIYTGASTVIHTRASDPFKNVEQERLGIEWNEMVWKTNGRMDVYTTRDMPEGFLNYWRSYLDKAARFRDLIRKLQGDAK